MPLKIRIDKISLPQEELLLNGDDLIIITGPNNCGKSQLLKDIYSFISGANKSKIVRSLEFSRLYNEEEFQREIEEKFPLAVDKEGNFTLMGMGYGRAAIGPIGFRPFGRLADLFCYFAHTDARLTEVTPAQIFDRTVQNPEQPIQRLYADDQLEKLVSDRFKSAFGVGLVVHRTAGSVIPLYVGDTPDWTKENDRLSTEYAAKVQQLSPLAEQGDGMRAFAGLLLKIMTFNRSVILIDEPEAFLHPPQARLIGTFIAKERKAGKQIFVSTHSSDVLKGLLDAKSENMRVARLMRTHRNQHFYWQDVNKTKEMLSNTILRASNIMDSLFHKLVMLCEGDRDAVFYGEIMKAISVDDAKIADIVFINTNGKDRMPDFIFALRDLGVNPIVVSDIDLIRSLDTLRKMLVAKAATNVDVIVAQCENIVKEVEQKNVPITAKTTREEIQKVFDGLDEARPIPQQRIRDIKKAFNALSPFAAVKAAGYRALPHGQCQIRYKEADESLRKYNIWLVPEGEIEGFLRTGSKKGQEWIVNALDRDLSSDPDLASAREFMSQVLTHNI